LIHDPKKRLRAFILKASHSHIYSFSLLNSVLVVEVEAVCAVPLRSQLLVVPCLLSRRLLLSNSRCPLLSSSSLLLVAAY
jgi:hypothetical protein